MATPSDPPVLSTMPLEDDDVLVVPPLPPEARMSVVALLTPDQQVHPRYQPEEELGRGGMGRVLSVFDRDLNRRVAMKTVPEAHRASRRFVEEARVSAQLEHPNVLPVYDFGVDDGGHLFFTMKHVEGHVTLRAVMGRLARGAPQEQSLYTFEQRVQLIQQVCRALAYAHARGVCHRDLKPENILIGPHGEVYLADWGIAALRAGLPTSEGAAADAQDARKTSATRFAGMVAYMSPERLSGRAADFDVDGDLYGLCAVLYELLTLEHYVTGGPVGDRQAMYERVIGNRYVEAKLHRDPTHGAVPPALSHILKRGLSLDPAARFRSADELYDALQRWLEGRAPVACPRTAIQRVLCGWGHFLNRHRLAGPALTLLGALAVLACVLYTLVTLVAG